MNSLNSGLNLLLICDDEQEWVVVIRALRQTAMSLDIQQCDSAAEGLQLAAAQHFDAILLDYHLQDQGGIEILRQLRSGHFKDVAILMFSSQEDELIAKECLEAGAQDFLWKDEVSVRRLSRAVRQAKQRYAMQQALNKSHEQLRILSESDALTGLCNRRGFEFSLSRAISRARRRQQILAVLLIDLDDFKIINDSFGHAVGDALLKEIARRLRAVVREEDTLCRLGGDEFVVLAINFEKQDQVAILADRIVAVFQKSVMLDGLELHVTASIGVALLGESADEKQLLEQADLAMYRAKRDGRNQARFYSDTLHNAVQFAASLKQDLVQALERNELKVYYQAQFNAVDNTLAGMEALLRWHHPRLGVLRPMDFMQAAEETGMIVEIGNWVLQNACHQLGKWQKQLPLQTDGLVLSINLSVLQLKETNLLDMIEQALHDNQLQAASLELDITESMLSDNGIQLILSALSERGVSLSLDDFGSGESALQNLPAFPINVLKIDQSFIATIGLGVKTDRLLIGMIRFAQTLELKVVAEGVETSEQAQFCSTHGCDLLQGYYYSHPLPAEDFETIFLSNRSLILSDL